MIFFQNFQANYEIIMISLAVLFLFKYDNVRESGEMKQLRILSDLNLYSHQTEEHQASNWELCKRSYL